MKKLSTVLLFLLTSTFTFAQFAPPAGEAGSSAVHKDSSIFVDWAKNAWLTRGWQDVSDTILGKTEIGDSALCVGQADNFVTSIGDGGVVTLSFNYPIFDGAGWDFAVFENAFSDGFLELAFVEVSSDGQNFFRFPAASLTQDTLQTGPFGLTDATKINNLAGKYRLGYGTPFDLSELSGITNLDIQNISHVRIIDVIGSISPLYGTQDTAGNYVNDPWPTPFVSSGFDLDAVGVINAKGIGLKENLNVFQIYPNPASEYLKITYVASSREKLIFSLYNMNGLLIQKRELNSNVQNSYLLDLSNVTAGQYIISLTGNNLNHQQQLQILK
jgi:hypothetical protein